MQPWTFFLLDHGGQRASKEHHYRNKQQMVAHISKKQHGGIYRSSHETAVGC